MAKVKHSPQRTCKVCRQRGEKKQLERWVATDEGLTLDRRQVLSGRGYYTCSRVCATKIHQHLKYIKRKR